MWLGVGGTWSLESNGTAGIQAGFGSTHYFSDRWGIGGEIDYNSAHFSGDPVTGVMRVHQSVEFVLKRAGEWRPFMTASHGLNNWLEETSAPFDVIPEDAGWGYGMSAGIGYHMVQESGEFGTVLVQYHHTFGVEAARPLIAIGFAAGW